MFLAVTTKSLSVDETTISTPDALVNLTPPVSVIVALMSPMPLLLIFVIIVDASKAEVRSTEVPLILNAVALDGFAAKSRVKSISLEALAVTP